METTQVTPEELHQQHPGWTVRREQLPVGGETWTATRTRLLTHHEVSAGHRHTLAAPTGEHLARLLLTQSDECLKLKADFPGWSILLTDRRRWWALRTRHVVSDLIADTLDGLRELLDEQTLAEREAER
ncbi:hypothetical protein [Actinomadura flavalba]|uniref:hypothetical protein n=1 Tax=Actinomadura flavalba TaxID=1120938 RepID=UPI00036E7778|nr:hypothetical protein [Actinomadura flavalba]